MSNNQSFSTQTRSLEDNTVSGIIERYKDHPRINLLNIKIAVWLTRFLLRQSQLKKWEGQSNLLTQRKLHKKKIHANILKQNSEFFAFHVQKDINTSISASKSPNDWKEADVIHVYKKKSKLSKENYRPTSILPNTLKCMKVACIIKYQNILKLGFLNFSVVFERVILHSTVY